MVRPTSPGTDRAHREDETLLDHEAKAVPVSLVGRKMVQQGERLIQRPESAFQRIAPPRRVREGDLVRDSLVGEARLSEVKYLLALMSGSGRQAAVVDGEE
jgi:hypothetical protein